MPPLRRMWDREATSLVRPADVLGTFRPRHDRVMTHDVPGTSWGFVDRTLDPRMTSSERPRPPDAPGTSKAVQRSSLDPRLAHISLCSQLVALSYTLHECARHVLHSLSLFLPLQSRLLSAASDQAAFTPRTQGIKHSAGPLASRRCGLARCASCLLSHAAVRNTMPPSSVGMRQYPAAPWGQVR